MNFEQVAAVAVDYVIGAVATLTAIWCSCKLWQRRKLRKQAKIAKQERSKLLELQNMWAEGYLARDIDDHLCGVKQEDGLWEIYCPALHIRAYGETYDEAVSLFKQAAKFVLFRSM